MSSKVTYRNGVFVPLEELKRLRPGQRCTVFSDEELAGDLPDVGVVETRGTELPILEQCADDMYDEM